jgi:hypothetical protein
MADSMKKYGLFIDDLTKIRILEPEVATQTNKLREECQNFVISKSGEIICYFILQNKSFIITYFFNHIRCFIIS